jgi:hypothetical protein
MRIMINLKAGGHEIEHNQAVTRGVRVKSNIKAGAKLMQHNQTISRGLKIKSGIKAGASDGRSYVTGYFAMDLDGLKCG